MRGRLGKETERERERMYKEGKRENRQGRCEGRGLKGKEGEDGIGEGSSERNAKRRKRNRKGRRERKKDYMLKGNIRERDVLEEKRYKGREKG